MTLSPKPNRHLTVNDLSSISQDTSDEKMIQEITRIRKSNLEDKKEKDRLMRQIESLQNNITCAENAREIANANAIKIARKLCSLFGEKLNQEQIYNKISELQERAAKAKREVEELQMQIDFNEQIARDNLTTTITLNNTMKSQINDTQIKASKAANKTEQRVQEIEKKKNAIQKMKKDYQNILNKLQNITKSSSIDPNELKDLIFNRTEAGFLNKANQLMKNKACTDSEYTSIPQFCSTVMKEIKCMKQSVKSNPVPDLLRQNILKTKEELDHITLKVDKLQRKKNNLEKLFDTSAKPSEMLNREQKLRCIQMKQALAKACKIVGLHWNIPSNHSDLCNLYVTFASNMKNACGKYQKENDNLRANQILLDQKIAVVKTQNEEIATILRAKRH